MPPGDRRGAPSPGRSVPNKLDDPARTRDDRFATDCFEKIFAKARHYNYKRAFPRTGLAGMVCNCALLAAILRSTRGSYLHRLDTPKFPKRPSAANMVTFAMALAISYDAPEAISPAAAQAAKTRGGAWLFVGGPRALLAVWAASSGRGRPLTAKVHR